MLDFNIKYERRATMEKKESLYYIWEKCKINILTLYQYSVLII